MICNASANVIICLHFVRDNCTSNLEKEIQSVVRAAHHYTVQVLKFLQGTVQFQVGISPEALQKSLRKIFWDIDESTTTRL